MENSNKEKIIQLSTHDTCRQKLSIFYGSNSNYLHGFREVLINAVDEISNNFESGVVSIELASDNQTITIKDSGRGIHLFKETNGTDNYKLLFDTLFAGTNYENIEKGKVTTGTNGVGTCVLNHTSEIFKVVSWHDNIEETVEYHYGELVNAHENKQEEGSSIHGTQFTFKLDDDIYTNTIFKENELEEIIDSLAGVTSNITYTFTYNGNSKTFHYENELDYIENRASQKLCENIEFPTVTIQSEVNVNGDKAIEVNKIKAIISLSSEPFQQTFLNRTQLIEHGTIFDGVVQGIIKSFNKHFKASPITKQDVEMSFNIFASVLSTNVEFANQTKFSTSKNLYKKLLADYIVKHLEVVEHEKPTIYEQMKKYLIEIHNFNTKSTESIKKMKKKLSETVGGINGKVEGLIDCKEHGENAELFICEGQSAKGSCVDARIARNQAVFAIRGKILSCLKADYNTIFNNEIVTNIFKILGCGIEIVDKKHKELATFNKDNLRFGKIILTADADCDGDTICCLLLTMFYRLAPTLIKDGHIYIARTPLFEIKLKGGKELYANNDKEKENILKEHGNNVLKIQRAKGLGELDARPLHDTTMNPDTRIIERVYVEDAERMSKYFEKWFGKDVAERKEFIGKNFNNYDFDLD